MEQIFTNTGRAYEGDPIDWNKEAKEAGEIEPENIMYEVTNKEGPDADLPLPGVQVKVKDIQLVEATVPKTKYFPRLPGQSPQPIIRININRDDSFLKQLVQQVANSEARAKIYKQLGMELTTTKGEMSLEVMDEMISEVSKPLATRILRVAIKEEMADVEYIPYKTQKVMKALTGKPMQMRKTIHKKAETEAEVVDLISSDEEMEDVRGISTTTVKQEAEGEDSDEDNSNDDAECTSGSSEESSDDKFGIKGLKEIYEEHSMGEAEQQMDGRSLNVGN